MISFIKRLFIVTALVFLFSYLNLFVNVKSFEIAIIVSIVLTIFLFLIKILAGFLKVMGCFTAGLTYIVAIVISIFAMPTSLYYAQDYISGFAVKDYTSAIIFSIIISVAQGFVDSKESK